MKLGTPHAKFAQNFYSQRDSKHIQQIVTGPPFPRPGHTIIVHRVVLSVYHLDSVRRTGGETGQLD